MKGDWFMEFLTQNLGLIIGVIVALIYYGHMNRQMKREMKAQSPS